MDQKGFLRAAKLGLGKLLNLKTREPHQSVVHRVQVTDDDEGKTEEVVRREMFDTNPNLRPQPVG